MKNIVKNFLLLTPRIVKYIWDMKRIILKMGVLGVFCLIAGCSDDGSTSPLQPVADNDTESSSDKAVDNSSSGTKPSSASSKNSSDSKSSDTSKVHEQVIVTDSGEVATSYVSSGVFCWTAGCEAQYASSSSAAPQSSETITITVSSSSAVPPTVTATQMVDNRNNKTYRLENVAGKLWMAEDLNFETANSMCFDSDNANCNKYGRLYTYSAATRACPDGWRLPNRDEAQAVINAEDFPWSYSGRCKGDNDCDFTDKMGFHWTSATAQEGDKNFDSNKGDSYAVIIVEKEPEYAGEGADQKFFQVDSKTKFFSVRCVQE